MPPRDLNDSKHWRDRATEMRVLAEAIKDARAAGMMLNLADDYDKLADRAEERSKTGNLFPHTPSPLGHAPPVKPRQ